MAAGENLLAEMIGKVAKVLVITLAMIVVTGCATKAAPTVPPEIDNGPVASPPVVPTSGSDVYVLGIFEDLTTTNYWAHLGSNADGTIWNSYVLSGSQPALYGYSDQRFDWVPSLAEDFPSPLLEESIGGQARWTTEVDLKPGMRWTDGSEVTAEDFVFTVQSALDLQLAGNWNAAVNPEFLDHAEAEGPYHLKIFFKKKPGLAIWQFGTAFMPIMSRAYWEPVIEKAKRQESLPDQQKFLFAHIPENQPSAGGYNFKKWEKGAFAEKSRNDDYFFAGSTVTEFASGAYQTSKSSLFDFTAYGEPTGEKILEYTEGPHADGTIYTIYGNQETAVLALKNADIDFILNPNGLQKGLHDQVKDDPGIGVVENASNGFRYLAFNFHKAPMDHKAFRHAVATLIDKEFLTSTVLQGVAIPMYTTVPQGNGFWYNPKVPMIGKGLTRPERIAESVRLLKDAGFTWETEPQVSADGNFMEAEGQGLRMPNGELVPELEILSPSAGYDPLRSTFAIWIERWLNDVGIPARAKLTGFNIIVETISDPEGFDMYILGWALTIYPDYLESFFHSRHNDEEGLNRGGYSNPEFDSLADSLLEETDLEEARQQVFQMQEFLADDLPYVVLFTTPILETYRKDRLEFPYTNVLNGIQGQNGLTTTVLIK